ncbi:MAG: biopolymer transporter ExbD [bacterium]|nr:biopolymer transporter ExbD [bacterium]
MPGVQTPSKFLKFKPHHARRKVEEKGVPITSMMDMMTIVLVFLLKTFSTQGDISATAAKLSLPKSDSKSIPGVVDRVAVGTDAIYFLEEEVITTDEAISSKDIVIKPLKARMETRVEALQETMRTAGREAEPPKILVLADKNHYFSLIKKVVATAASAGYMNITLASIQDTGKWEE